MDLHELPFAKIIKISDDIAEIIVNEGVDYSLDMVRIYQDWLHENMADPCYVMINRVNSYSLSFEAQQKLGAIEQIKATALVTYNRTSTISAQAFIKLSPNLTPLNSKVFHDRDSALAWLRAQRTAHTPA